jgi:preprotein translocase subunit SecG
MSILLNILTVVLIFVSLFLVLVVLAQKAKNDGGMGAAMGGGMAEAAFGADTGNVLSKATINGAIAFFVLAFALYLGRIYQRTHHVASADTLPTIAVPVSKTAPKAATAAPAATTATKPVATPSTAKPVPEAPKKP